MNYSQQGKRLLDVFGSALALIILFPLLGLVAALIAVDLGRPIVFRHRRAGRLGHPFTMFKFRTMTQERDDDERLLPDELRVTRLGNVLRSFSVDELPSLVNVLRGEMSLVGPRPLLIDYVDRYNAGQRRRLLVRPGITGWAQIHGRNATSWGRRFDLDVWYVDHVSLRTDLRILLTTFWKVVTREGISHPVHGTMTVFEGDEA